jgi:hypothetical protein
MPNGISMNRRDFLKLWGSSLFTLAPSRLRSWLPPDEDTTPLGLGRVTIRAIGLYEEPDFASPRIKYLTRDSLVDVIAEINSPHGPARNPRWYRLIGGYAHSSYIQRVDQAHLNPPLAMIPRRGRLGEISVPYTQSMRKIFTDYWKPAYRLYYGAVFWITGFIQGPDGVSWYELTDDLLGIRYCIPTGHIRPISRAELSPLSPDVPADAKSILISIAEQRLYAFEGDEVVFQAPISSGIPSKGPTPNGIPTDTPKGNFSVARKTPSRHMGDGNLTSDPEAYELPGVPWVSFFHSDGIGCHGTYWHDNFGSLMSHGCVNMRNTDAKWVYRWTTPVIQHAEWYRMGRGTTVQVV